MATAPRRRWIKLWTQETLHGTTFKELSPPQRAVWFGLLCLAGDSVIPGQVCVAEDVPYTDGQLAHLLHLDISLLDETLPLLEKVGKISHNGSGVIIIEKWAKYQPKTDELDYHSAYMRDYRKGIRRKIHSELNAGEVNEGEQHNSELLD